MNHDFSPVEFFKEELASDTTAQRLEALRKVNLVAHAVGPDRTRDQILPIITDLIRSSVADELLYTVAELLPDITQYLGTSPDRYLAVLPALELLMSQEETIIRDRAVKSVISIVKETVSHQLHLTMMTNDFIPITERLAEGEWFTSRVSACELIPTLYTYASDTDRTTLLRLFKELCEDDMPMVERAAAARLADIGTVVDVNALRSSIVPRIHHCWRDDAQDAVRAGALTGCIAVAKRLSPQDNETLTLPLFVSAAQKGTWKIRMTLAEQFEQVMKAMAPHTTPLLPHLSALLEDPEHDIRSTCLLTLSRCVTMLTLEQIRDSRIAATFERLAKDPNNSVRVAAADVIVPVACVAGKAMAAESFLPIILELMRDAYPNVRLNVLCHGDRLCDLFDFESIGKSLVEAFESLMADPQRRIRLEAVNQLPRLARKFGTSAFRESLEPLYFSAFSDRVHAVRRGAVDHIETLGELLGSQWIVSVVLPKLLSLYYDKVTLVPSLTSGRLSTTTTGPLSESQTTGSSYLTRIMVVQCIPSLIPHVENEPEARQKVVTLVEDALQDNVANVRLCACRTIKLIKERSLARPADASFLEEHLKLGLQRLRSDDPDADVHYYVVDTLGCLDE